MDLETDLEIAWTKKNARWDRAPAYGMCPHIYVVGCGHLVGNRQNTRIGQQNYEQWL